MAITEHARHRMVEVLVEHLGEEAAMSLVEHLPPVGWADVATRHDIEALRRELLGELHTETGAVRGELHALRGELHAEISAVRSELHTEIGAVRGELHALRGELHAEIGAVRGEIGALRGELHAGLADVRDEVHDRAADTMRTLVLGFVGALTANTAIILTAIRLSG